MTNVFSPQGASQETDQAPFSVAIVGAGPVGLYAASLCGMLGLRVIVFETSPFVGGQCAALYPSKEVKGVPGFQGATAQELVTRLEQQARASRATFFLNATVENIREILRGEEGEGFELSAQGRTFAVRTVLIAAGMGRFYPNKPTFESTAPDVLNALEGKCVHYAVPDPERFRGQRVVIAGGGDSAVDWAFELLPVARSVTLVHRRETFRCAPASCSRLLALEQEGLLTVYRSANLKDLRIAEDHLTHVVLQPNSADACALDADHLLVFFGLTTDLSSFEKWDLAPRLFTRTKIPVNPLTGATAVPGVFAIGDIVSYPADAPSRINLIGSGFGEAIAAAYALRRFLYPNKRLALNVQSLSSVEEQG